MVGVLTAAQLTASRIQPRRRGRRVGRRQKAKPGIHALGKSAVKPFLPTGYRDEHFPYSQLHVRGQSRRFDGVDYAPAVYRIIGRFLL